MKLFRRPEPEEITEARMAKIRAEKEFRILAELGRKIDDFVEAVEGERQCP